MKRTLAIVTALASLVIGTTAHAAEVWQAGIIKYIYQLGDGRVILTFTSVGTCSSGAYYIAPGVNGMTIDGTKQLLSLVSLAAATDKQVQIAFDDSTTYCYVNRGLIVVN